MTTTVTLNTNSSGWLLNSDGTCGAVTALDAVTAPTSSALIDLGYDSQAVTLQTLVMGSPTAVTVIVEGSNDNQKWNQVISSVSTVGDYWKAGAPVRLLRVRLITLAGGTSPTVTAVVAAL